MAVGGITLLGVILTSETKNNENSVAEILEAQRQSTTLPSPVSTKQSSPIFQSSLSSPTPSPTASPARYIDISTSPTLFPTASPAEHINISTSPTPSPTASPAGHIDISTSPTPSPTALPQPASHIFYTSSHWKAKYYYCDTDNDWKDLSPAYLKSFNSEEELLRNYPRTLHEPCNN